MCPEDHNQNPQKTHRKESPNLYKHSMKGAYWVTFTRVAIQFLGLCKSVFFANFLILNDLGLIAIGMMLMELLNAFSQSGFQAALIQKKGNIDEYLDTAWIIGIARGALLYSLLFVTAPLFASFKVPPENVNLTISVIRALGICFLIQPFHNIGVIYFHKELEFHKTFWLTITGTLTDIILSITLVLIFRSVWAYVIARLAATITNLGMSYLLCSYRPRFRFIPEKAADLWKFGKWLFGGRIVSFLTMECDDYFVWFYLGIPHLALYRYAFNFADVPSKHLTTTIAQVSFPAYSKIQNDIPRLCNAYLKVLKMSACITIPTSFLLIFLGPDFVKLFLNERMHPMIWAFQILALKGLITGISATRGPLFVAMGKPNANWYFQWTRFLILAILIYPFTKAWGIIGTSLATLTYTLVVDPFAYFFACRLLKCNILTMFKEIFYPFIASVITTIVIVALKTYCLPKLTYFSFFAFGALGLTVYLLLMWIFDSAFNYGIRSILKDHWYLLSSKFSRKT